MLPNSARKILINLELKGLVCDIQGWFLFRIFESGNKKRVQANLMKGFLVFWHPGTIRRLGTTSICTPVAEKPLLKVGIRAAGQISSIDRPPSPLLQ